MNPTILFLVAAVLSYGLAFPTAYLLRRFNVIDKPNARSSHLHPTIRGGGIAILIVLLAGFVIVGFWKVQFLPLILAGAALPLAIVSFLDDLRPLPIGIRFTTHALAAILCLGFLVTNARFHLFPTSIPSNVLFLVVLFFGIVGYTNAFNFMDGINGIAAGQAVITGLGTALIIGCATRNWTHSLLVCSLLLSGAALGFLPHNFPRARMFMGDVGSAPLGFLLAALAVSAAAELGWYLLVPFFLLHANYILDTSITLVRRFIRGERVYESHKEHFYQRVVRAGKSHAFTTGWEMCFQVVALTLLIFYVNYSGSLLRFAIALIVLLIWLGFFAYAEFVFSRSAQSALYSRNISRAVR